jgi:hypothetical protein
MDFGARISTGGWRAWSEACMYVHGVGGLAHGRASIVAPLGLSFLGTLIVQVGLARRKVARAVENKEEERDRFLANWPC